MATCMRPLIKLIFLCLLLLPIAAVSAEKGLTVKGVRYSTYSAFTRIVFEIEAAAPYVLTRTADDRGLMFAPYEGPLVVKSALPSIRDGVVSGVELREDAGRNYLVVRLDTAAGDIKDFVLRGPDRIVFDISRGTAAAMPAAQPGQPVVIVLDPGHGGKDGGIVTAQGYEKAVVLETALAVRSILQKNPRLKVVLTRDRDQSLALDERASLSNAANAAVFVSIHGGAGGQTRVFTHDLYDDPGTQVVQPASGDFLGFEAGSEQQEMVWGRQQAVYARQSGGLGRSLARTCAEQDRAEAFQAPLAGIGAVDGAAALVEIGMAQDRSRIIDGIARGIEQYVREER